MPDLLIFGTREIASLAKYYFTHDSSYKPVAFTVDDAFVEADTFEGLPVIPFSRALVEFPPAQVEMHVALSYRKLNRLRQEKYEMARSAGYRLASYVSSRSVTWPDLHHGDNCLILENQTIQPTVRIGANVMIWSGNHLGHACEVGDHTYISSHVCIAGHTKIGRRCFLGVNCALRDFITVGDEVFVGMGANVTGDVADGSVVLGTAADVLPPDDRRARALKRNYFGV